MVIAALANLSSFVVLTAFVPTILAASSWWPPVPSTDPTGQHPTRVNIASFMSGSPRLPILPASWAAWTEVAVDILWSEF